MWKLNFFWVWVKIFDDILVDFQQIFELGEEIRAFSRRLWRKNSEIRWCIREMNLRKWWLFRAFFIDKNKWNLIRSVLRHMSTLDKNQSSSEQISRSCARTCFWKRNRWELVVHSKSYETAATAIYLWCMVCGVWCVVCGVVCVVWYVWCMERVKNWPPPRGPKNGILLDFCWIFPKIFDWFSK